MCVCVYVDAKKRPGRRLEREEMDIMKQRCNRLKQVVPPFSPPPLSSMFPPLFSFYWCEPRPKWIVTALFHGGHIMTQRCNNLKQVVCMCVCNRERTGTRGREQKRKRKRRDFFFEREQYAFVVTR